MRHSHVVKHEKEQKRKGNNKKCKDDRELTVCYIFKQNSKVLGIHRKHYFILNYFFLVIDAATVAVKPKQDKPLKIALLIQNDVTFNWDIRVSQLSCNDVYKFKGTYVLILFTFFYYEWNFKEKLLHLFNFFIVPHPCGITVKESTPSENRFTPTFTRYSFSFQSEPDGKPNNDVWWSYPEPIFNMYYYCKLLYKSARIRYIIVN